MVRHCGVPCCQQGWLELKWLLLVLFYIHLNLKFYHWLLSVDFAVLLGGKKHFPNFFIYRLWWWFFHCWYSCFCPKWSTQVTLTWDGRWSNQWICWIPTMNCLMFLSSWQDSSPQNHLASLAAGAVKQAKVGLVKEGSWVVQSWHLHKRSSTGWHPSLEGKPCEATTVNLSHP